jgi:DNA-binding NarL/FixJ family response regulator
MIRVLLADDHRIVREGLHFILEAPGDIQIIATVSNGQDAVEHAIRNCPDVAVIDVSMPIMDGIEATSQIRLHCPRTRIAMLSMYADAEYIERAIRAGASGYVLKDAAGSELVEAVRVLQKGDRYFSPQIARIAQHLFQEGNG